MGTFPKHTHINKEVLFRITGKTLLLFLGSEHSWNVCVLMQRNYMSACSFRVRISLGLWRYNMVAHITLISAGGIVQLVCVLGWCEQFRRFLECIVYWISYLQTMNCLGLWRLRAALVALTRRWWRSGSREERGIGREQGCNPGLEEERLWPAQDPETNRKVQGKVNLPTVEEKGII